MSVAIQEEIKASVANFSEAITLTVAQSATAGHAWAGACDDLGDGEPSTSTVNYLAGTATANLSIVTPDDGAICIWTHTDAHVVIDARAELVADQTLGLRPVTPTRVHDSREH